MKDTVLVFTLLDAVVLLLTELTSTPDDKILVLNIAKESVKKYRRYLFQYCIRKVSPILFVAIPITGAGTYSTDPAKAVPLFEVVRLAM